MAKVLGYHRPTSIDDALAVLAAPGTPKVILAGGTMVNAGIDRDPVEVVDLQALGLDGITEEDGRVRIGATVTLDQLATDHRIPAALADLARSEAPSTLRTLGTIGGLVAGRDAESTLLAALLVHDCVVTIVDADGSNRQGLDAVLTHGVGGGIITDVTVALAGTTAVATTARTPGDRPIVSAVARNDGDAVTLAMSGVAAAPVLVDDLAELEPPGDFRGSAEYRRHLASVLAARVRGEVS